MGASMTLDMVIIDENDDEGMISFYDRVSML